MNANFKKWVTNKYLIATAVFIVFMFFGDKNNIIDQYALQKQYSKVKREHNYYIEQIAKAHKDYNELFSNDKNLEKFAREKYMMKRDNEDVFVIVKRDKETKQDIEPEPTDTSE
jgi:cell division protein FtsB